MDRQGKKRNKIYLYIKKKRYKIFPKTDTILFKRVSLLSFKRYNIFQPANLLSSLNYRIPNHTRLLSGYQGRQVNLLKVYSTQPQNARGFI
jgi:hypothetical protein